MDFAAKGNFIELDANAAYEILEGILGIPPQKKGFSFTPEGVQMLDKLGDVNKKANFCEVGERKMANNVNCEEMRFVIRNLVMLKILPGNGARNSLDDVC